MNFIKTAKNLFLVFFGVCFLLLFPFNKFLNIEAQNKSVEKTTVSTVIYLKEEETSIAFDINLKNTSSSEDVITEYQFPNLWQSKRFTKIKQTSGFDGKVTLSEEYISIDLTNNPIKPGQTYDLSVEMVAPAAKKVGQIRYFKAAAAQLPKDRFQIQEYKIVSEKSLGDLHYINLSEDKYTLVQDKTSNTLNFKDFFDIYLIFGDKLALAIEYDTQTISSSDVVRFIPRQSNTQKLKILDKENISQIFRDETSNIFVNLSEFDQLDNKNFRVVYQLGLDPIEEKTQKGKAFEKYQDYIKKNSDKNFVSLPKKLSSAVTDKNSYEDIRKTILSLYSVDVDNVDFADARNEIPEQGNISGAEFLLLLSSALHHKDLENQIVLVDRRHMGESMSFVIDIEGILYKPWYSASEKSLSDGFGIQLLAFQRRDELVFEKINKLSSEYNDITELDFIETEDDLINYVNFSDEKSLDKEVSIALNLPAEVKNFDNFSAEIVVNNLTDEPLFLDALLIENSIFPIIDTDLNGLGQGILPGERKVFTVSNVFLPKVFFAEKERTEVDVVVIYTKGENQISNESSQSILLRQNFIFVGVVVLGFSAILISLYVFYLIYTYNKLVFISAFWRSRRFFNKIFTRIGSFIKLK